MAGERIADNVLPREQLWVRLGVVVFTLLVFWSLLLSLTRINDPTEALVLDRLERDDSTTQRLPDDWQQTGYTGDSAWYTAQFSLTEIPSTRWGIYLPTVIMNAAIYLNGELVGLLGQLADPVTRNWNRPLLFTIPPIALRTGDNELRLHVKADPPGTGLLGRLYLGPIVQLEPYYERAYSIRLGTGLVSVISTLTMAFFMFVLWFMRRQDKVYLWFGIGLVCWSVHNLNIIVNEPPLPAGLWVRLSAVAIIWVTICTAFYALRFLDEQRRYSERLLLLLGLLNILLLPLMPDTVFHPQQLPLYEILAMGIGGYATSIILGAFLKRRELTLEISIVTLLGVCMMSTGAYDFLVISNIIARSSPYMLPYSGPLVILGFGFVLLHRFASALHFAENLNIVLEHRVAEKSRELERNYEQLNRYRHEQAITEERQRIIRDMHDGFGGQLVSTLVAIEGGKTQLSEISRSLRDALNDLRLTMDSLDPEVNGLGQLLGQLRSRLQQQLEGSGIALNWQVRPLPQWIKPGPQESLHVLRIIQEAITNTLKHANASTISVQTGAHQQQDRQQLFIDISDDGSGIPGQSAKNGRGLLNMQVRASKIGAQLLVTSNTSGTHIRLLFERSTQEFGNND